MGRIKTVVQELPEDDPKVIAYRMGQLEKVVKESTTAQTAGFATVHEKLDNLNSHFVSHDQMKEIEDIGNKVHEDHERRLRSLEKDRNRGKGALGIISFLLVFLAALVGALWWIKA